MPYQIGANNSVASVGFRRDTLDEAKRLAQELKDKGYSNVTVKDAAGNFVWEP